MLVAEDLVSARAGRAVHAPVAFDLARGEALLLRGANGSGKSTLLRTLAGFLPPAAGTIRWNGRSTDDASWRTAIHWVGHDNALKSRLTVRENLLIAADLAGAQVDPEAAASELGLRPLLDELVGRLSQGQRRRASLARLSAPLRPVWLLDEPGVGLDAFNARQLATMIHAHRSRGGIAVVASHGDVALDDPMVLEL